jgi:DNA-binding HxlR family transcriptional regulator
MGDHGPGPRPDGPRICSIADALDVVGERYSLLILRELGFGVNRFNDIRHNIGAPRGTLAQRLRKLEETGIIERRRYNEPPPRDEYLLTDAGRALEPILRELRLWGEQFAGGPCATDRRDDNHSRRNGRTRAQDVTTSVMRSG